MTGPLSNSIDVIKVTFDDLRTLVSSVRLPGSSAPTPTAYRGSEVLAFPNNVNTKANFLLQLPHGYKEGEDIEIHLHYALPTAGAGGGAENVQWDLTQSWANINEAIPVETGESPAIINVQALSANTHYVGELVSAIDGTGKKISSFLLCSITRNVSVADNYSDDVYLLGIDAHVPINSLGSREEFVK